ncbi:hypothetical protein NBRC110019_18090 [Neptunitalea chrysea]|uniref:Helix-turn-helix domain-containing protein n=1 Tax=Neptunitalea chrysea TaxID=1647581 RepID=A0A9W6B7P9_9FLAO|nr:helix-turn-helix domain-containing protein [Neptunitalea chrysea]GLB52769.1 hypothetical protein NBRC110019_18090 [Neptunitalea chrysea]
MSTLYLEGMKLEEFDLHVKKIIRECLEELLIKEQLKDGALFESQTIPLRETNSELLSRKEVSQYLKVSLVTLNEWEKRKILVPIRIGTRVRYRMSDIQNFTRDENN